MFTLKYSKKVTPSEVQMATKFQEFNEHSNEVNQGIHSNSDSNVIKDKAFQMEFTIGSL
jgi:hypothetical protein